MVAAAITILVRLSTAPSIMQSIIIPVLYCTWQYAPLGRPRTITYLYVYNNYCVIVTNIKFKSLKTQNSQILDEEFNENSIELHIYKALSHILLIKWGSIRRFLTIFVWKEMHFSNNVFHGFKCFKIKHIHKVFGKNKMFALCLSVKMSYLLCLPWKNYIFYICFTMWYI